MTDFSISQIKNRKLRRTFAAIWLVLGGLIYAVLSTILIVIFSLYYGIKAIGINFMEDSVVIAQCFRELYTDFLYVWRKK